jgi:hypothetical protein
MLLLANLAFAFFITQIALTAHSSLSHPDTVRWSTWERPAPAGAEGATAPETLRQKDHVAQDYNLESDGCYGSASADGVILSGKETDGAPKSI